jgi:hypothetical protein
MEDEKKLMQFIADFVKEIQGVLRFAANSVAELQLGMGSRRGKVPGSHEILIMFVTHGLPGNSRNML